MQRVTMNLDEKVVREAQGYAPGLTRTELIHQALHALIREGARERLIGMHGAFPDFEIPGRRRWDPESDEDVVE